MATSPVPSDRAAHILRATSALVVLVDSQGTILDANPAAAAAIGQAVADLVGEQATSVLCTPRDAAEFRSMLRDVGRSGVSRSHEHELPSGEGIAESPNSPTSPASPTSIAWATSVLSAAPHRLVCVGVDVSAARWAAVDLLERAMTDDLTGLPNRAHLMRSLAQMAGSGASVLFCDLNGFKSVNDTFGHAAGDAVLVEVARRLKCAVRGEDLVARLGGDEFVIIAPPHPTASPEGLARRVLGAMRQPMILAGGVVVLVGVSIGRALMEPGQTPADVLHQADAHMYIAKSLNTSTAALVPPGSD